MAHIRIENEYTRCPEFTEFACTPAYGIWTFLMGQVIRGWSEAPGAQWIYHKYLMADGWLCASYSVENIAKNCRKFHKSGQPNKSWVSRWTKKLVKMGLVKKHKNGRKVIYQLGYLNKNGKEVLFIDEYFGPKAQRDKKHRMEVRADEYNPTMDDHYKKQLQIVQL
jgi:hypothetical protein